MARSARPRRAASSRSWSFNYFFYNHRMKKVLFFTCSCTRISSNHGGAKESGRRNGPDGDCDDEEDIFDFDFEQEQDK